MVVADAQQPESNWQQVLAIGSTSFVFITFIIFCGFCFKKKSKDDDELLDDTDWKSDHSGGKAPLLAQYPDNFKFFTSNNNKGKTQGGLKPADPALNPSPGYGRKNIHFQSPNDPMFDNVNIQPKHKDLSSSYDSLASWTSTPAEPDIPMDRGEDLGSLYFSISYNVDTLVLKLTIQKAVNLPAKDISGTSDPFVKVLLLPDRKNKLETRVKRKKLNPIWNEVFTFEGFPHQKLLQRSLYLQVLDYDRFSRNDPIGEIELPLNEVHLQLEPVPFVKKLMPCKRSADYLGDLLVGLMYNPTSAKISLTVLKCINLKVMDLVGSCDPYVKIYCQMGSKRIAKEKTRVQRRTLNPIWNEKFEFDAPIDKIRDISFVLTVLDFDRFLPNESIGQVIIGYRTSGTSLKQWTEMMNHPRKFCAEYHKIIKY